MSSSPSSSSDDDGPTIRQQQQQHNYDLPYVSSWLPPSLLHSPSSPTTTATTNITTPHFKSSVSSVALKSNSNSSPLLSKAVTPSTTTSTTTTVVNNGSSSSNLSNNKKSGKKNVADKSKIENINLTNSSSSNRPQQSLETSSSPQQLQQPLDEKTLSDMDDEWNHIIEQYHSLIRNKQNNEHEANHDLFNIIENTLENQGGNYDNSNLSYSDRRKSMLDYPSSRSMTITSPSSTNQSNAVASSNIGTSSDEKNKKKKKFSSLRKKNRNTNQQQHLLSFDNNEESHLDQHLATDANADFPTLSFCDLMLIGASQQSGSAISSPNLMRSNIGNNIITHYDLSLPSASATSASSPTVSSLLAKGNGENDKPLNLLLPSAASTTPLSPSFPTSTTLTTKPLSLDLSKLKAKSTTSQSASCQTPEVSEKKKIFKRRERSASSFSLGGSKKHPDSPIQRHHRLNNSDSNSNGRLQQGMSFTKWSELIQNNGAFARINNISPSSPALGQNDEDSQSGNANDILSHDSTEIFDQLEDILSYQLPISPRYRTYSKSSRGKRDSSLVLPNEQKEQQVDDENNAQTTIPETGLDLDIIDGDDDEMDDLIDGAINNFNQANHEQQATKSSNDSVMDLQFALIGSRGKMADWMKEKEKETLPQNLPSLRESRSPDSRKVDPSQRVISKTRFSFNSRSAINLNATNNQKSLIDDLDSEKSTSFTEGNSPQFRPKGRKRSLSHMMVNASVCLHFSIDNFKGIDEFIKEEQEKLNLGNSTSDSQSFCVQLHVLHRVKKPNNTYAWISLTHTQNVNLLDLESFNWSDKSKITSDVVHFETSATLPFNFEKITPLLFALISTRTNQVLGSYEGCLAEICGSQQLMIRRKLIKQKKHFCDLVVKASIPTGNEKRLSALESIGNSVKEHFSHAHLPVQTPPIDLFNDIPNTESPIISDTSSSSNIGNTPDMNNDGPLLRKKLRAERKRKKSAKFEEIYLDFDEIQAKLEKKYKDCFLVVSQQFYTDKNQLGSFIPLYTSETNTKLTKTPSFETFSIKPTLEFTNITFRFELFYWVSIDKQQYDDLDVMSPRQYKQSPVDPKKSATRTTTIGHYRRLIGSTEVTYTDFIKFFDLPSVPAETRPHSAALKDQNNDLLLGPFFHISSTGLNEANNNSTTTPRRTRKSLKNVSFEGDGSNANSTNPPTTTNRVSPLTMKLLVDRRVHIIKEETLAPQGMDPIEDENNPSVVHRRRKVLTVVNVQSGSLTFKSVKERKVFIEEQSDLDVTYTFLDYMKTGLRFKCYFALDFTKDNTEPRNEGNLHIAPKGQKSIYEQCIESISKRIFQYDPNMTDFHLVGFGNDTQEPVFNLYSKGDESLEEETASSSMYYRDDTSSNSEDKSQNYIYSVLYPRYYPPLKIHQLSPIYRQYISSTGGNFKLTMQDCVKTRHYAFTETNVRKGTRDLTNANRFSYDDGLKNEKLKRMSSPEFIHLNYIETPKVTTSSLTHGNSFSIKSPIVGSSSMESDKKSGTKLSLFKNNIFESNKMTSKYAPNDYYPVISDVIDLSCNLKNEESIAQTLLYLYREQQMSRMGHRNSCSSSTSTDSSALMNITPVLYNILVILIPNDFIHVEETIYKFVEASHKAALSIIVIGVGSGCGFKTHRSINTNTDVVSNNSSSGGKTLQYRIQTIIPTTSDLQYRGLRAARGCVTFVRLNDHETVNEAVEAALQHIPKQVCRYMKMKGMEILSSGNQENK